jgi:hypothetical protein
VIQLRFAGSEVTRAGTITLTAGTDELDELIVIRDLLSARPEVQVQSSTMEQAPPPPPLPDDEEESP